MAKLALLIGALIVSLITYFISEWSPSRIAERKYSKECAQKSGFTLNGLPDEIFKYQHMAKWLNQYDSAFSAYPDSITELEKIGAGILKDAKKWKIAYARLDSIDGYKIGPFQKRQVDSMINELNRRLTKGKEFDKCRDSAKAAREKR